MKLLYGQYSKAMLIYISRLWMGLIVGILLFVSLHSHAYLASHNFLQLDRCEVVSDSEVDLPYGQGHPVVDLALPNNAMADPLFDEWTGNTINEDSGLPTYHKGKLGDNTWYITDGTYQALVIVGEHGIILVDAPKTLWVDVNAGPFGNSNTNKTIVEVVAEISPLPIKALIYSHIHMDHIGAAGVVKAAYPNVEIIAHRQTKLQLKRGSRNPNLGSAVVLPKVPLPTKTFSKVLNITLGKYLGYDDGGYYYYSNYYYHHKDKVRVNLKYFGATTVRSWEYFYLPTTR